MLVQQRNNKKKRVKFAKKFASLETMKTKGEENGLLVYISIKEREMLLQDAEISFFYVVAILLN